MSDRNPPDLESHGNTTTGPASQALAGTLMPAPSQDAASDDLLQGALPSDDSAPYVFASYRGSKNSGRINSLARRSAQGDDAADISVQIVSKTPYDVDMKRKYAKHLKTTERLVTNLLVGLWVENPQRTLWMAIFLLVFGVSFVIEFLQNLPASKAPHVARRTGSPVSWAIYGWGLPIAKGAAQAIKVTAMVLLFPVARSVLSFLRTAPLLRHIIPFDDNISFHRLFGYILFLFAWIHTLAHIANSLNQTRDYVNDKGVGMAFNNARCGINLDKTDCSLYEKANPEKYGHENTLFGWWSSETSITGIVLLAILCIGYPCAVLRTSRKREIMKKIIPEKSFIGQRLYSFSWFFFTHQFMTIAFYVVIVLHPLPGLPGRPRPHSSTSWVYVVIGLIAYTADRTLRLYRQASWQTTVLGARILPGGRGVLELKLKKPRNTKLWRAPQFSYKPGQFAHLNVPAISFAEWHPFTITSVPSDNFIMFHIQSAGDWTAKLHECIAKQLALNSTDLTQSGRRLTRSGQLMQTDLRTSDLGDSELSKASKFTSDSLPQEDSAMAVTSSGEGLGMTGSPRPSREGSMGEDFVMLGESGNLDDGWSWKAPIIHVDGPSGAPAQNYKDYKVLLLVGGNIGVTPFISIIRKLLTTMEMNRCSNCGQCNLKHVKHKHVYFFWTIRDADAVQYFNSTFAAVKKLDTHGVLDIRIHLTSKKAAVVGVNTGKAPQVDRDLNAASSLGLTIYPGRPDWRGVFQTVCDQYPRDTVGVFCCGPFQLCQDLKVLSREFSTPKGTEDKSPGLRRRAQATKFDFFKEHF